MKDAALIRDKHMSDIQKLTGTALSIVGFLMTGIHEKNETLFEEDIISSLNDVGQLLSLVMYKQTKSRKTFIEPGLSDETKAVLKDVKTDEFLFGKDLPEKLKQRNTLKKISENLKAQKTQQSSAKQNLNSRAPLTNRPRTAPMGSTFTGGQQKRPVSFRSKQQFINQQVQSQQKPQYTNKPAQTQQKQPQRQKFQQKY